VKRLLAGKRNGRPEWPLVFLYELVDESGTIDVIISESQQPPEGYERSEFLPSTPVGRKLAKMLRAARIDQLHEWRSRAEGK
jgi:hypothetical protein